ncbi:MAG: A24 family peptidase [Candidatus Nanoarchaeia archaeon]|nr:A24 family peptidase [Candidatus Nanoarchaeia archaeon]
MIEVVFISLFYLIIGSIEDLKKHEVYDFLNFSYLILMCIVFFINFLFNDFIKNNFLSIVLNIGVLIGFSLIMYFFNQWGGGDAKLMFGLSIALTLLNVKYYDFLFNLIFFGGIYSLICLFYYIFKSFKQIREKLYEKIKIIYLIILLNFIALMFLFLSENFYLRYLSLLVILISILLSLIYVAKISEEYLFKKEVKVNDLTEGDWVVGSIVFENEKLYDPKKENGISLSSIKKLKKLVKEEKIENIFTIKTGIAYFPAIFLAFVFSFLGYSTFNYFLSIFI